MHVVSRPVKAQQLYYLYPLLEMQVLLRGYNVYILVKIISFLSVYRRGYISCDVQRRAVRLGYEGRSQSVRLQIHYFSALRLLNQVLVLEHLDYRRHLVGIKAFAGIGIEFYTQHLVNSVEFLEALVPEPLPKLCFLFFTVFQPGEYLSRLVVQLRMLFNFFVEFRIVME